MNTLNEFCRLYPVQKTLRMGLEPVGQTLDNMNRDEVLTSDENLKIEFYNTRKELDKFHKYLIEKVLLDVSFNMVTLQQYADVLLDMTLTEKDKELKIEKFRTEMRNVIGRAFSENPLFPKIFKKEMFTDVMPGFLKDAEQIEQVEKFADYTGYFADYNLVRKNLYESKPISGSVATRVVHDNFPIFCKNMAVIRNIMESEHTGELKEKMNLVYSDFEEYLNVMSLDEMFSLQSFNHTLNQSQIDVYNLILGGKTLDDGISMKKGLNSYINEFNSRQPKENKIPKLTRLKKMILSDRESLSWLPEKIETDEEILTAIAECYKNINEGVIESSEDNMGVKELLKTIRSFSLGGIFIKRKNISFLSNMMYGKWDAIRDALIEKDKSKVRRTKNMSEESVYEKAKVLMEKNDSFSLQAVMDAMDDIDDKGGDRFFKWMSRMDAEREDSVFARIEKAASKASTLLDYKYPENRQLVNDSRSIELIKNLMDELIELKKLVALFIGTEKEENKDVDFYHTLLLLHERLSEVVPLYNIVRNYLTRKPYSNHKIKLNLGYANLLGGWDADKNGTYGGILLRKDNDMYLGIIRKGGKLNLVENEDVEGDNFEHVIYKQVTGANKMFPKIFFSNKWLNEGSVKPTEEVQEKYKKGLHLKGNNFDKQFCHMLIDYFKESCRNYEPWNIYDFRFSDTGEYEDISQFYHEFENQAYRIQYQQVSADYIMQNVEDGNLYLFKIYNRDLSPYSKGKKSLQTLYYQMLFDQRNLEDLVIKLNGGAAMFFRKKSIVRERPTHAAGEEILSKNPLTVTQKKVLRYDLMKDRRYMMDKFLFNFTVTINCNNKKPANINNMVNDYIRQAEDLHIIGINRGERNLLYVSVIDMQGNIKEQYSLNTIVNEYNDKQYPTNYNELLTKREMEREEARKSWNSIKNIAELKEGYLSYALHKIVLLQQKYNAVIAIENLNDRFVQKRRKIEKEIYQKFDDMLVNKLNYLVDKQKDILEPGGVLRGLQLTGKTDGLKFYTAQNGILFRIPTWYIGMTCPVTGFINFLNTKYHNIQSTRTFLSKFDNISYNAEKGWFEFDVDYDKFTDKAEGQKKWTVCTAGHRKHLNKEVYLTKELMALFERFGINPYDNLKEAVLKQDSKEFFESLLLLLTLTLQMRNHTADGRAYLVSPVKDKDGNVFTSLDNDNNLPESPDANDAYNIARKALMYIGQIKAQPDNTLKLSVSNKDWQKFVQDKPYKK